MKAEHQMLAQSVFVIGMHRSGTSALAGALSSLGVNLGNNLIAGDANNPKGYFENLDIVEINEAILKSLGCCWHSLVIPDRWQDVDVHLRTQAQDVISRHLSSSMPWGFKDPRVTRLLPFWQDVLKQNKLEPRYILANRHPLSVARSLNRRDNFPVAHSLALWLMHQYAGLQMILADRVLVVDYDLMLSDPSVQLKRISAFLDIDRNEVESQDYQTEFLDESLRHSEYTAAELSGCCGELGQICRTVYEYLQMASQAEGTINQEDIHLGESILSEVATYIENQSYWLFAIDEGAKNAGHASAEKTAVLENKNRRLESQIKWLESNPVIQLMRSIWSTSKRLTGSDRS